MTIPLSHLPKYKLAHVPTPLESFTNLSGDIGNPHLYIKRDDCTGLATGGNKVRQLEFQLGQTLHEQSTSILVSGALQSNMVRCTAAAAAKLGIECHIFLSDKTGLPGNRHQKSGNIILNSLFGAFIHNHPKDTSNDEIEQAMTDMAFELRRRGHKPYIIQSSTNHPPYGALGYVEAAEEIAEQLKKKDVQRAVIVVASGSGTTQAGLIMGARASEDIEIAIHGICVRREKAHQQKRLIQILRGIEVLLDCPGTTKPEDISLSDDYLDSAYGMLGKTTEEAMLLGARQEGILLDPVYTGKAFAGFLDLARQSIDRHQALIFLHTGGFPVIFAYEDEIYSGVTGSRIPHPTLLP